MDLAAVPPDLDFYWSIPLADYPRVIEQGSSPEFETNCQLCPLKLVE